MLWHRRLRRDSRGNEANDSNSNDIRVKSLHLRPTANLYIISRLTQQLYNNMVRPVKALSRDNTSTSSVKRARHPPALTRCRRANACVCTRLPQTPIKTHKGTPACGTATAPLVASKASIIPVSRYLAPRSARKMMPRPQKIAWRGDIRGGHATGAGSDAACLSAPPRTFTSDYIRPSRCKGGMHRT